MKRIVVYSSKTGFTLKYAKEISEKLDCEIISVEVCKNKKWNDYDTIIYGGSLKAGIIRNLSHFRKIIGENEKRLVVFASGLTSKEDQEKIQEMVMTNHLEKIPFYYYIGGVDYGKLGFASRTLLKMISHSIKKNPDGNQEMAARLEKSGDYTVLEDVNGLVNKIKNENR